jgi:hypothetical protein
VWYVNGIVHVGTEALFRILRLKRRISLPKRLAKFFCSIDRAISHIPVVKNYPWHWNVIMTKKE